ncbi:MAG: hypothetical protein CW335_07220 [Clostridiales bacterium]|nr:hypothetical protein [Clostridiales bacterium]
MWYRDPAAEDAELLQKLDCAGEIVRISMVIDRPTGAVALKLLPDETAQLCTLALLPEHRGKGLAAQLLGEAVSIARKAGKRRLTAERMPDLPAAAHLLTDYGFTKNGMSLIPAADLEVFDEERSI